MAVAAERPAGMPGAAGVSVGEIAAGLSAVIGVAALGAAGYLLLWRRAAGADGHPAPDLAADAAPVGSARAPVDFRPDATAAIPAGDREAFRPATAGPIPVTG